MRIISESTSKERRDDHLPAERRPTGAAKWLNNSGAFSDLHRGREFISVFQVMEISTYLVFSCCASASNRSDIHPAAPSTPERPSGTRNRGGDANEIKTRRRYECVAGRAGRTGWRGRLNVSEMAFWSRPTEPAALSDAASAEAPAASR